jgi:hypothetical protein
MLLYGAQIKELKWKQFLLNGAIIDLQEFIFVTGINIDRGRYLKLCNCLKIIKKYCANSDPIEIDITTFFNRLRKGSKDIRKILSTDYPDKFREKICNTVKSYERITNTDLTIPNIKRNLKIWNVYNFPNRFKVFLFKFYGNILGTNDRISHFNAEKDPSCYLCKKGQLPAPLESFTHIFYDCPTINGVITLFINKYLNIEIDRMLYFSGYSGENERDNYCVNLVLDALRYNIWQYKLTGLNISFASMDLEVNNLLESILNTSKKIKTMFNRCSLFKGAAEQPGVDPVQPLHLQQPQPHGVRDP